MPFKNRKEAGQQLAKALKLVDADLVIALPRGGVPVGYEVAQAMGLPLDITCPHKIGTPEKSIFYPLVSQLPRRKTGYFSIFMFFQAISVETSGPFHRLHSRELVKRLIFRELRLSKSPALGLSRHGIGRDRPIAQSEP